jgi:hypothetical protein
VNRYTALLATSLLVGCGAASATQQSVAPTQAAREAPSHSVPPTTGSRGWLSPRANAKHPWMYVASGTQSIIAIYDLARFGTPKIGEITQGLNRPGGLAVDAQGTLYAANYDNGIAGGTVAIYPAGATSPSLTLSQGLSVPLDVAVDANGDVYVVNRGSPPSIVVYPPGQTTPSRTITSSLIQVPAQVLFDSARNLYFSDNVTGVSEIPFGSQQPVSLNLQGPGGATGGIALDAKNGNLFVSYIHGPNEVLVYAPGKKAPLRKLKGFSFQACFLNSGAIKSDEYIFVPDCGVTGNVWVFKHNASNPYTVLTFTAAGGACCIAFKPAGVP